MLFFFCLAICLSVSVHICLSQSTYAYVICIHMCTSMYMCTCMYVRACLSVCMWICLCVRTHARWQIFYLNMCMIPRVYMLKYGNMGFGSCVLYVCGCMDDTGSKDTRVHDSVAQTSPLMHTFSYSSTARTLHLIRCLPCQRTHTPTRTYMQTNTHAHTQKHANTRACAHTHTHTRTHAEAEAHAQSLTRTHTYAHTKTCIGAE